MELEILNIILLILIRLHDFLQNKWHVFCLTDHILKNWIRLFSKFFFFNQIYQHLIPIFMNIY